MEIVSGTFALFAPFTLISNCTICPTAGCESLKTAVTLGDAAKVDCIAAIAIGARNRIRWNIDIFVNYQPSTFWGSPVIIDTASDLAFIKLNSLFFVLHRFQKKLGLFLTHLSLFFRLRFG